jgi:hypothetical protein
MICSSFSTRCVCAFSFFSLFRSLLSFGTTCSENGGCLVSFEHIFYVCPILCYLLFLTENLSEENELIFI